MLPPIFATRVETNSCTLRPPGSRLGHLSGSIQFIFSGFPHSHRLP